ncbi:MAG: hypothetical protein ABFS18_06190 [Thermodesulfobacteriota bacterium]
MARKIILLVSLLIGTVCFISPVVAADMCEENINTVCIGCHNTDDVCENLGASEKTWKDILEWMVANGAELEEDEIETMVKCFSEPSAGAKAACGK